MSEFEKLISHLPRSIFITHADMEGSEDKETNGPEGNEGQVGFEPTVPPKSVRIVISFSMPGLGFGEISLVQSEAGQLFVDTECMSPLTVIQVLAAMLDGAITDYNTHPKAHRRYNEVMGRICGTTCDICNPDT